MVKDFDSSAVAAGAGDPGVQRRVARALDHVRKLWIPINRVVFERIKQGLFRGTYDRNRDDLIRDLRGDMALFTWCLRGLAQAARNDPTQNPGFDPIVYLRSAELADVRKLFNCELSDITSHELERTDDFQAQLLRDVILGASAAEVVSERSGKDADRAYGASLLRQLGLVLVSWNYPSVVQEALAALKDGVELDLEISKRLGFSPGLLALELVREWGVSPKKCFSLGLHVSAEEIAAAEAGAMDVAPKTDGGDADRYLRDVVEVGEKLARVNNPEAYPTMRGKWAEVEGQVKAALGVSGMARIRERFEENFQEYARALSQQDVAEGPLFNRQRIPDSPEIQKVIRRNKYIEACEMGLKHRMRRLYADIDERGAVDREILRVLLNDVVVTAGFAAGCVYTHDPVLAKLVPQLKIRVPRGIGAEPFDCKMATSETPLVVSAFQSVTPITSVVVLPEDLTVLCVAGPFGRRARFGVLYLETLNPPEEADRRERFIAHFQALCRALTDCLNL